VQLDQGIPQKDWDRLSRSGRYDLKRLKEAMVLLIGNDAPLGREWLDHPLKGDWADHRECHLGGDFSLMYRLEGNTIIFVKAAGRAATDRVDLDGQMPVTPRLSTSCMPSRRSTSDRELAPPLQRGETAFECAVDDARRIPPAARNIHQPRGRSQITLGTQNAGQVTLTHYQEQIWPPRNKAWKSTSASRMQTAKRLHLDFRISWRTATRCI
jgi:mRNA interferase YafQ